MSAEADIKTNEQEEKVKVTLGSVPLGDDPHWSGLKALTLLGAAIPYYESQEKKSNKAIIEELASNCPTWAFTYMTPDNGFLWSATVAGAYITGMIYRQKRQKASRLNRCLELWTDFVNDRASDDPDIKRNAIYNLEKRMHKQGTLFDGIETYVEASHKDSPPKVREIIPSGTKQGFEDLARKRGIWYNIQDLQNKIPRVRDSLKQLSTAVRLGNAPDAARGFTGLLRAGSSKLASLSSLKSSGQSLSDQFLDASIQAHSLSLAFIREASHSLTGPLHKKTRQNIRKGFSAGADYLKRYDIFRKKVKEKYRMVSKPIDLSHARLGGNHQVQGHIDEAMRVEIADKRAAIKRTINGTTLLGSAFAAETVFYAMHSYESIIHPAIEVAKHVRDNEIPSFLYAFAPLQDQAVHIVLGLYSLAVVSNAYAYMGDQISKNLETIDQHRGWLRDVHSKYDSASTDEPIDHPAEKAGESVDNAPTHLEKPEP